MKSGVTLRQLARLYAVQGAYNDIEGKRCTATDEELWAVLRALEVDVDPSNPLEAWRDRADQLWSELAEPVLVAWDGASASLGLRLPGHQVTVSAELSIDPAVGPSKPLRWSVRSDDLPLIQDVEVDGTPRRECALTLPAGLPVGYHQLTLELLPGGRRQTTLVISAPSRAYLGDHDKSRLWGVFAPIYALRSETDWGVGDYTHLERLGEWVAGLGGGIVATLPFCATFLDTLFTPSPYAPASRLFWNELFVDPHRAPGADSESNRRSLEESAGEASALRSAPLVDYRAAWGLKRRVLSEFASRFFDSGGDSAFDAFVQSRTGVLPDYARFRAATERFNVPWRDWPQKQRDGRLTPADWDPAAERLQLYVQWLAELQIDALARRARQNGPGLYVDLPLGVHDCGFDAWRHQDQYALGASAGAPPDSLFTGGQNWGFPPLNPFRIRQDRYRHVIDFLGHIMRKAGILRVDHVMGLHRLFWIPNGIDTRRGIYVRYPAEELYAILSVESHRNQCLVVGENLGTVPSYVNRTMRRRSLHGMYVMQYVLEGDRLPPVPRSCVASLNTHDMPPFAGYWRGMDIEDRLALGFTDESDVSVEREQREGVRRRVVRRLHQEGRLPQGNQSEEAIRDACIGLLGASKARMVLVNLEDLWLETAPQNIPGIGDDRRPIWRRRLRQTLDEARHRAETVEPLERLNAARNDR